MPSDSDELESATRGRPFGSADTDSARASASDAASPVAVPAMRMAQCRNHAQQPQHRDGSHGQECKPVRWGVWRIRRAARRGRLAHCLRRSRLDADRAEVHSGGRRSTGRTRGDVAQLRLGAVGRGPHVAPRPVEPARGGVPAEGVGGFDASAASSIDQICRPRRARPSARAHIHRAAVIAPVLEERAGWRLGLGLGTSPNRDPLRVLGSELAGRRDEPLPRAQLEAAVARLAAQPVGAGVRHDEEQGRGGVHAAARGVHRTGGLRLAAQHGRAVGGEEPPARLSWPVVAGQGHRHLRA
mmetsp:Transcript_12640/g.32972  ORF Transcript_12640/g.32972 Transcript_12640/m.32972 type:complete len:299 (+) Transcript_12640:42-938(+)